MLKKFFLIVCGSFVGSFLALIFFTLTAVLMSMAIFASMNKATGVKLEKNSILYIKLDGSLEERATGMDNFMTLLGNEETGQCLNTVMKSLELAKDNKDIKGVYLDCRGMSSGMSSLYELRGALQEFKKSKKFVYAFGDEGIMQSDYYLASVADSIFLNPVGSVDIHGLGAATPYLKKLLDKVGVKMQVVRVGSFKSAVEPYMLSEMSPENREQQEHYLGQLWGRISADIAFSRHIDEATFKALTDSVMITMSAEDLLKSKIVDHLCYRTEMEDKLRKLTDLEKEDDLKLITPSELVSVDNTVIHSGNQVAIVYAVGEIDASTSVAGMQEEGITSESLAATIRELQYNEDVKALVLRVNSPGGSAFGSEVIWKAIEDFKSSGKPVAVSMGDYAASGGYYISSGAQRIFAEPVTITGSIGIFGVIPSAQELVENTLGVKVEEVTTNENAIAGATYKDLTPVQLNALQRMVERGYDLFTNRCAAGRHVSQDSIKSIGQGRVWDGITAREIGLVDQFGGLNDAVKWVAYQAKLGDDYETVEYPEIDMSFSALFGSMTRARVEEDMRNRMGLFYTYYEKLQAIFGREKVLCLMEPVDIDF
ncbi:MAG: signal peptide peptidase SppA [Muribaculaceae bacterium]|nr:signal peptide peptidase SppA [Muribaculaceae bacterium]